MSKRVLTPGETAVLTIIQEEYGPQNGIDQVFFPTEDEAVIFVRTSNGTSVMMAHLSNLAAFRADGIISSDDELRTKWLRRGE